MLLEPALVPGIDLVAVAVALGNLGRAVVDLRYPAAALKDRRIGAEAHGAAEIALDTASLELVALHPLGHQTDDRFGGRTEFGRVRLLDATEVARGFDDGHLHSEANPEIRQLALARELNGPDFPFGAALAEAARYQNAVHVLEKRRRILALEHLGFDPIEIDADLVGDAAVGERLDQRLIGVFEAGIFADDGNRHIAFRVANALVDETPTREIRFAVGFDPEGREHLAVEPGLMVGLRHRIDAVRVARFDHRARTHVAEQGELGSLALGDRPVGTAQQDVGLNADRAQFLDRVLGRLGLELARAGNERQERQVDVDGMMPGQLVAELPDRLEERQALDITDRAPDLAQDEIEALVAFPDEILDRVGDVGNHLNGGAEIIAAPLLGEDLLVDATGGDVVVAGRRPAGEALVMAEVEVGLRTVIGDENLAVLVGRHRPGIDVEIGVELAQPYLEAARLQQRAERCGCETLAEGGDHAAGNEDVPRHGT